MLDWKTWVKNKRQVEDVSTEEGPSSKFKFSTSDDMGEDYEHIQTELFKAVLTKYPEETLAFLNQIADRGDQEIAMLLQKLQRDQGSEMAKEPSHPSEKDTVMPSSADTGYNPEQF